MGFFDLVEEPIDIGLSHTTACSSCKLFVSCNNPNLKESVSDNFNGIMLLLPPPTKAEDEQGKCGVGDVNNWLKEQVESIGISWNDCLKINSIGCYAGKSVKGLNLNSCYNRIDHIVKEYKPKLIISFGTDNLTSTVGKDFSRNIGSVDKWISYVIPNYRFGAWLTHVRSPKEILFHERYYKNESWKKATTIADKLKVIVNNGTYKALLYEFKKGIRDAVVKSSNPLPAHIDTYTRVLVVSPKDSISVLKSAEEYLEKHPEEKVEYDLETSGIKLIKEDSFVYSASICYSDSESYSFLVTNENKDALASFLSHEFNWVGHNFMYDAVCSKQKIGYYPTNLVWDTMLVSHWLNNADGVNSLKFNAYVHLGISDYESDTHSFLVANNAVGINRIKEAPVDKILLYGGKDTLYTRHIRLKQEKLFADKNIQNKEFALQLLFKGSITLGKIELNGMPIDKEVTANNLRICKEKMQEALTKIESTDTWSLWKSIYKDKASVLSDAQTIGILYKQKKLFPTGLKKTTAYKADKDWLSRTDDPICNPILEYKKYQKMCSTYLEGFLMHTDNNGRIYSTYSLANVSSFRGSSDNPNLQNVSAHDPVAVNMLRTCFKAPAGYLLCEYDFSALEMYMSLTYSNCPMLEKYLTCADADMHSDTAKRAFMFSDSDWDSLKDVNKKAWKEARGTAKKINFGLQYGSYYELIGSLIWTDVVEKKLMFSDTLSLADHLIKELSINEKYEKSDRSVEYNEFCMAVYTEHMKSVESDYWERFVEVKEWRDKNYASYLERGFFCNHTGFFYDGYHSKNATGNYPVQSVGFHILLWCLCRVQHILEERKLKTQLVGEIHDSMILLIPEEEKDEILKICDQVMTKETRKVFTWLNVDLQAEPEITPVGGSWAQKAPID